jgi:hypothetical protein
VSAAGRTHDGSAVAGSRTGPARGATGPANAVSLAVALLGFPNLSGSNTFGACSPPQRRPARSSLEPRPAGITRLYVMGSLGDDLCRRAGSLESPAWHGDVLSAREAALARGEAEYEDRGICEPRDRGPRSLKIRIPERHFIGIDRIDRIGLSDGAADLTETIIGYARPVAGSGSRSFNYLTATGIDIGLLLNFGAASLQFKWKSRESGESSQFPQSCKSH